QAYARSGHYTMKLYREEVSPAVDLFFDVSESMFFEEAKAVRSWELFCFSAESARQSAAALRCYAVRERSLAPWPIESVFASSDFETLQFRETAWPLRRGSMRVLISDLLFATGAEARLDQLSAAIGMGVILAPFSRSEREPDW